MALPPARERLIVALDFPAAAPALALANKLEGRCLWLKVGLELYLGAGAQIVETLCARGYKVFLDLKLHDIPNTVAAAVRTLSSSGASLLTVHASGGAAMLAAAAEAAQLPGSPRLLAVTVLTSLDGPALSELGLNDSPAAQVLRLAQLATANGIDGLVCSPHEIASLRKHLGPAPLLVVPGIRAVDSDAGDQRRTATPAEAVASGASMLVVGRPITGAADPVAAVEHILHQVD